MWPFKKKLIAKSLVKEKKKEESEHKYDKDRFIISIQKDKNHFLVKVFDNWSDIFHRGKEKGLLDCRTITFVLNEKESKKEGKYVDGITDNAKEHLRKLFTEKRDRETKKYNKKEKSKK